MDALDQWLADCLRNPELGQIDVLENIVAECTEHLSADESNKKNRPFLMNRIAALHHDQPRESSIPFTDREIREQVRAVLGSISRRDPGEQKS